MILTALSSAASTTTAVPCWSSWKTGMSSDARSGAPRSRSSAGREMSSRLMPPKPGAIASTVATIASGSLVLRTIGNASTPANSLKSMHLPSITGIEASGPMSPRPSTAEPSRDDGDRVALDRVLEGLVAVVVDRHADAGDARRVRHREVVAGLERVLVALLDLAADVHAQRAVGGVDDRRRRRRRRPRRRSARPCSSPAVSTVMSRSVWPPSSATRSTEPIVPPAVADRAGDLAEHAGAVVDLDAQGQGVLGGGRAGHVGA